MKKRDLYLEIWRDLSSEKNMIFVAGPRQAGKTTLSQIISKAFTNHVYFNWDIPDHRAHLFENPSFFTEFDRKVVFSSAIFLLTTTAFNEYAQQFDLAELVNIVKLK